MSTSLKQLMEQDAGRPVSPAPIDDVLAGGRSRLRRRRVISVAAAVVLAVLAIAVPIGLVGGDDSTDEPIEPPERTGWGELDGPWVDMRSIHFGDTTAARPREWNVDVLTSTRDSAVYWTSPNGRRTGRLIEMRPDGSSHELSRRLVGVPFTDPAGSLVAWQERTGQIVAYDTSSGSEVARHPVGDDTTVNAVDAGVVTYTSSEDVFTWQPGDGEPERTDLSLPDGAFITDVSSGLHVVGTFDPRGEWYVMDGEGKRVITFEAPLYGEFDPSGRYLALTKLTKDGFDLAGHAVRALDAEQDTELSGYDGDIYQLWWDPSGDLVVGTVEHYDGLVNPDDEATFYRCQPATGSCERIPGGTMSVDAAPRPANFENQIILSYPG